MTNKFTEEEWSGIVGLTIAFLFILYAIGI